MAREFARMGTDLFDEESIRELTRDQQRAYFIVCMRPDLSRCGVVSYTPRRWARYAKDDTETKLRKAFAGLTASRHVVIDEETDELLVRTYVRHDGLLRQPNVVAAMCSEYRLIESPTIRYAFLAEMRRLWSVDDPPLDRAERAGWLLAMGHYPPAAEGRDAKFPDGMTLDALARLQKAIGAGLRADLADAIAEGFAEPFTEGSTEGLPEPFSEGFAEPFTEGSTEGLPEPFTEPFDRPGSNPLARAGARSPAPAPTTKNNTPPAGTEPHQDGPASPSREGHDDTGDYQCPHGWRPTVDGEPCGRCVADTIDAWRP